MKNHSYWSYVNPNLAIENGGPTLCAYWHWKCAWGSARAPEQFGWSKYNMIDERAKQMIFLSYTWSQGPLMRNFQSLYILYFLAVIFWNKSNDHPITLQFEGSTSASGMLLPEASDLSSCETSQRVTNETEFIVLMLFVVQACMIQKVGFIPNEMRPGWPSKQHSHFQKSLCSGTDETVPN